LNEDIQKISIPLPFGNSILSFEESADSLIFAFVCLSSCFQKALTQPWPS
jgi:hypothetical protein